MLASLASLSRKVNHGDSQVSGRRCYNIIDSINRETNDILIVQADIAAAIIATIGAWFNLHQDAEMTTVRLGWSGEII